MFPRSAALSLQCNHPTGGRPGQILGEVSTRHGCNPICLHFHKLQREVSTTRGCNFPALHAHLIESTDWANSQASDQHSCSLASQLLSPPLGGWKTLPFQGRLLKLHAPPRKRNLLLIRKTGRTQIVRELGDMEGSLPKNSGWPTLLSDLRRAATLKESPQRKKEKAEHANEALGTIRYSSLCGRIWCLGDWRLDVGRSR
jgi:hypothetical protein